MVQHRLHQLADHLHLIRRDVRGFENIVGAAQRDVRIHFLHSRQLELRQRRHLRLLRTQGQLAGDLRPVDLHVRQSSPAPNGADQRDHDRIRHIEGVDQNALPFPERGGKADQDIGQLIEAGIDQHGGI
jgi:hypothetical protein